MTDGLATAPTPAESAAANRWRAVEGRVYPLIMSDPDLYELVVGLIVEARDILRTECSTVSALMSSEAETFLSRCPSRKAVESCGYDPEAAFDAARAQRFRELVAS